MSTGQRRTTEEASREAGRETSLASGLYVRAWVGEQASAETQSCVAGRGRGRTGEMRVGRVLSCVRLRRKSNRLCTAGRPCTSLPRRAD
eukprot:3940895-Rhodomonas_salina.2